MRYHFPNMTRPKKAAKRLVDALPETTLSAVQAAVVAAVGYRDWHDLTLHHAEGEPSSLDQTLSSADFRARVTELVASLANSLALPTGEAQYALSRSRLTGDRPFTAADHEAIRTAFWRRGPMPWPQGLNPGATFFVAEKGYAKRRAYVRDTDRAVSFVSDTSLNCLCADFEAQSPRVRMEDFVPLRLTLPYGWWTLDDGSEVLFSRDYKPLWRIAPGGEARRMEPWIWITGIRDQRWFGKELDAAWDSEAAQRAAGARLARHGITELPMLADLLPFLLGENISTTQALDAMRRERNAGNGMGAAAGRAHEPAAAPA